MSGMEGDQESSLSNSFDISKSESVAPSVSSATDSNIGVAKLGAIY